MITVHRRNKVGEGTYGVGYSADILVRGAESHSTDRSSDLTKKRVVVKRMLSDQTASWIGGIRELDTLAQLRGHDCIISLESVSVGDPFTSANPMTPQLAKQRGMKDDKLHLITSYEEMSGEEFIRDRNKCTFGHVKTISCQLLLGLEFIHSRRIAHRDIKPPNTLISFKQGTPYLKICDFGMSRALFRTAPSTPGVTTSWYRPPEVCLGCKDYNLSCDMWGVGCLLFEFVTGRAFLYSSKDIDNNEGAFATAYSRVPVAPSETLLRKLRSKASNDIKIPATARFVRRLTFAQQINLSEDEIVRFNQTPGTYSQFIDLLDHLLVFDPNERYTATEALAHPFFDAFRTYISAMRIAHPLTSMKDRRNPITIINCRERKWAADCIKRIYDHRTELPWYRNDVIFHALDLFDRYLGWATLNLQSVSTSTNAEQGRFLNKSTTILYLYTCVYMMHKYYSTLHYPLQWYNVFPKGFNDVSHEKMAEWFEFQLLRDVLQYRSFHPTLLEMFDTFNRDPSEINIYAVLKYYLQKDQYVGTVEDLFNDIHIPTTYCPSPPPPIIRMPRSTSAPNALVYLVAGPKMSPLTYAAPSRAPSPFQLNGSPYGSLPSSASRGVLTTLHSSENSNPFFDDKEYSQSQIQMSAITVSQKQFDYPSLAVTH